MISEQAMKDFSREPGICLNGKMIALGSKEAVQDMLEELKHIMSENVKPIKASL